MGKVDQHDGGGKSHTDGRADAAGFAFTHRLGLKLDPNARAIEDVADDGNTPSEPILRPLRLPPARTRTFGKDALELLFAHVVKDPHFPVV